MTTKKRSKPRRPRVWYCLYDKHGIFWERFETLKELRDWLKYLNNKYPERQPWEIEKYVREVKRR